MNEKIMLSFPWVPDVVNYTAYKFGICELCEKKKLEDKKWDNSECPHCKGLTKIISGMINSNV